MSSWSGGDKRRSADRGWRGKKSGTRKSDFGWQSKPTSQRSRRIPGPHRQTRWTLYTLLAATLLGIFLWLLLVRPQKTPLLMAIGERYAAPIPPNTWIQEDKEALFGLEDTLDPVELPPGWIGKQAEGREALRQQLAGHQTLRRGFRRIREPLIVYFSMPGVVNEKGEPCLLPPGASPWQSNDWIRVESIVDDVAAVVPDERPKLLVLDSSQVLVNWRVGIVYNTFAERLREYFERQKVPNLAILTSADVGQSSWASPQLDGSAFGRFLQLGLAGAGDQNDDGEVQLLELGAYLRSQVDAWARANRNAYQQPVVLVKPNTDFVVTHSLDDSELSALHKTVSEGSTAPPSVDLKTIERLWGRLDELQEQRLMRADPLALGEYRNRLMRVERLAYGGKSCEKYAIREANELADDLNNAQPAEARIHELGKPLPLGHLHTLALREYFGRSNQTQSRRISELWERLATPTLTAPRANANPSSEETELVEQALAFEETHLLVAAYQQRVSASVDNATGLLKRFLELRRRSEKLAVPLGADGRAGDLRAHFFVRRSLEDIEQRRRRLEDGLFVAAVTENGKSFADPTIDRDYDAAEQLGQRLANTFEVCDQIHADGPFLAQWLCSPGVNVGFQQRPDQLLAFFDSNHRLGRDLDLLEEATLGELQQQFQTFRQQFDDQVKASTDAVDDGRARLELEGLLDAPLIPAARRLTLLERRDRLEAGLHEAFFGSDGGQFDAVAENRRNAAPRPEAGRADSESAGGNMARWSRSPLLAILQGPDAKPAELRDSSQAGFVALLEDTCWRARKLLSESDRLGTHSIPALEKEELSPAFPQGRWKLSRVARSLCSGAPFRFAPPDDDPVARLRRFDLQQLFIWHARHALEGFWHQLAPTAPKSITELLSRRNLGGEADARYFEQAANDFLDLARRIYDPPLEAVNAELQQLATLVGRRREASVFGIQFDSNSTPVLGSKTSLDARIDVAPHPRGASLPPGVAAVYVAGLGGRVLEVVPTGDNWGGLQVPIEEDSESLREAQIRGVGPSNLHATAFFRGREYQQLIPSNVFDGALVQYAPPVYERQSVTLFGDELNPPAVVFVLDCSDSMKTKMQPKDPNAPQQPRMEIAVRALENMLKDLASRTKGRPRVGLRFFGHRVAWTQDTIRLVYNPNEEKPENLPPAEDVERILPLSVFNSRQYGVASKRLGMVSPFGLTPVNLAILQAREDFRRADDAGAPTNESSKSIIVITDGEPNQYHPTDSKFGPVSVTTADDVVKSWNVGQDQIPVYIIGFGIPNDERRNAVAAFQQIASSTGGEVLETDSEGELIAYLEKRLEVNGYLVTQANGRLITRDLRTGQEKRVELDTPVDVPLEDSSVDLDIDYKQALARVSLEGGEALELEVKGGRNGARIVGRPYEYDVAEYANLTSGPSDDSGSLLLRLHRPKRSGDRVRFRFSVQDEFSHFTPRPKAIWIEVTPERGQGAEADSYLFYDPVYQPNTPVPVVDFTASNWPQDAGHALVRFWCSNQPTSPDMQIRLADVRRQQNAPQTSEPEKLDGGLTVRARVESERAGGAREYRVIVDERWADEAAQKEGVRIWLNVTDPDLRVQLVSRQVDRQHSMGRHQFVFRSEIDERTFANKIAVQAALGATIKEQARKVEGGKPVRVRIFNADGSHPATAARPIGQ